MIAISIQQAAAQMLVHATGVIPDPAPAAPVDAGAMTTLVQWIKYGALMCCFVAAVIGGGMIPLGNTSRRAEMAERGKVTLICAVIGAIIVGGAGKLVTSSYGLA